MACWPRFLGGTPSTEGNCHLHQPFTAGYLGIHVTKTWFPTYKLWLWRSIFKKLQCWVLACIGFLLLYHIYIYILYYLYIYICAWLTITGTVLVQPWLWSDPQTTWLHRACRRPVPHSCHNSELILRTFGSDSYSLLTMSNHQPPNNPTTSLLTCLLSTCMGFRPWIGQLRRHEKHWCMGHGQAIQLSIFVALLGISKKHDGGRGHWPCVSLWQSDGHCCSVLMARPWDQPFYSPWLTIVSHH